MTISFYLKRPNSDNPTIIFARIYYGSYETKCYTNKSIHPDFWNKKTKRARETKKFPQYPEFNTGLNKIADSIEAIILNYQNENNGFYPTPEKLKPLMDAEIRKVGIPTKLTFIEFFNDFISRCENGTRLHPKTGHPITTGTIKTYKTTLECIKNYEIHRKKKVDFEIIDMPFYSDFTKYLTLTAKQSTNYIGKSIKVLKTVLQDATELGVNKNMAFRSKGFTTISEEADTVYLSELELDEIKELDLSHSPTLDSLRDLFLVGCHTGLRFSDLSSLSPSQISGDLITLTQIKTKKAVVIPVHDTIKEILKKYNGKLPQALSNQKSNEYLKDICKMDNLPLLKTTVTFSRTKAGERKVQSLEKWNLVTTHTARRSFATNEYLAGTPTLTIMAITGHKTEKAFLKYIKVTPDQHAKILQGLWSERKKKKDEVESSKIKKTTKVTFNADQ